MQACPMVLAIWGCLYAMTVVLMGQSVLKGLEGAISLLVAAFWSGHLQLALPCLLQLQVASDGRMTRSQTSMQ